jgi:hypothetical protein
VADIAIGKLSEDNEECWPELKPAAKTPPRSSNELTRKKLNSNKVAPERMST